MVVRAEILLLCAGKLPFIGFMQKLYRPGTRASESLVQDQFWGPWRSIDFSEKYSPLPGAPGAPRAPGLPSKALNRFFLGHSIISIMEEENLIIIDLIRLIRQIQLIRLIRLIRLIQFIRLIQLIQLIRVIKFFK